MNKLITNKEGRQIKDEEKNLIISILELAKSNDRIVSIPEVVYDLEDGGIRTIKLTNNIERVYGKDILQVNFIDSDKTPVIITLTIDNKDDLFELEFWKVNFEKLNKYPKPNEIQIIQD